MPPRKQVHALQAFAKDKVLYNVCAIILDEIYFGQDEHWDVYGPPTLSVRLRLVRDILSNSLTPGILEDLLNTILSRDEAVEAIVRYLAIQLLLVEGVRNLTIGNFPESYFEMVLEATAKSGAGIQRLDLRGIWVREEHKYAVIKTLRKLSCIRRLTLRYGCDDDILATLGKYCEGLQKLDISGSRAITEAGLKNLCDNPSRIVWDRLTESLQIVDLGGPGAQDLPPALPCYLLLTLPRLVSLGSYEHTGAAVELAVTTYPGKQFGLRYIHDVVTSSSRFHTIVKACPKLQAIYLDSPKDTAVHYLDMFKDLREIKLHKVRWTDMEIMINKMGSRIRSLFLLTVFGQVDLLDLGKLCPNLQRLEMHNVSLVCSDVTHTTAFHNIRELLIYTSQISTLCVKLLMNQCVDVEHLCLGECGHLSDAAIITSLMNHSLRNVREIWFGVADKLTMRAIEALMEHCPHLTSLGNLAAWSVHPDDLDLLRVQFLLTNTDLTLHEFGPQREDEWIPIMDV
ncbi:F-box/LRR-repeat protein 4-like 2 [Homarus americanus]|uniref:F-box/LRR-repeat protein 4-like 2 n=2 Tax=Homarus americanus TaxID=6706 RepID=A0A8J5JUL3_HOMAM|nr:F-box/LRR-repeat protein 4-like 2 [Homarus americanus]